MKVLHQLGEGGKARGLSHGNRGKAPQELQVRAELDVLISGGLGHERWRAEQHGGRRDLAFVERKLVRPSMRCSVAPTGLAAIVTYSARGFSTAYRP